nr:hypothetical protein Iba_chr07aCG8650 [Ipomoea batatas]GMD68051.1 hypothetical protein Iba_chr12dCG5440 [Ipomoea batatas]GMD97638.1 hypothetical protein Iba_chr15cCG4500 [Ipomoea batatas]
MHLGKRRVLSMSGVALRFVLISAAIQIIAFNGSSRNIFSSPLKACMHLIRSPKLINRYLFIHISKYETVYKNCQLISSQCPSCMHFLPFSVPSTCLFIYR